jgi:hypothetical protein
MAPTETTTARNRSRAIRGQKTRGRKSGFSLLRKERLPEYPLKIRRIAGDPCTREIMVKAQTKLSSSFWDRRLTKKT